VIADVAGAARRGGHVVAGFHVSAGIGVIVGPIVAGRLADEVSFTAAFLVTDVLAAAATLASRRRHPHQVGPPSAGRPTSDGPTIQVPDPRSTSQYERPAKDSE
jgi:MFS family permease